MDSKIDILNQGVGFIRKEILNKRNEWSVIRDCLEGELKIKSKGFQYLPFPSTNSDEDCQNESNPRYIAYKNRANFMNVTRRTIYELLAQVFVKNPIVDVADNDVMKLLLNNSSGDGVSLEQCAKTSLKYALAYAYGGILVDFPSVENKSISVAEYARGVYRPTITPYSPFTIRNFRVQDDGVEEKLVLVVLRESYWEFDDDGFESKQRERLRVLRLNESGEYIQDVYNGITYDSKGATVGWQKVETIRPTNSDGIPLREIPFYFIGLENNNPYPDNPIMYDLASLNISHYRNSADYEETMFVAGQTTLFVSGLAESTQGQTSKIKMGVTGGIKLKNGGTCGLLQAKSDSGLAESMEKKEKAMAKFGAKFLETDNVAKTAYQVKVENPSQGSILANCASNVSDAYTKALKFAHELVGFDSSNVKFELNTDFEYNRVGSDEQNQVINSWTAGAITFSEMRNVLKRAGVAVLDDNEALLEIAKQQKELADANNKGSTLLDNNRN